MYAIEFQTNITNGIIEVPASYRNQLSGSVRVIILTDTSTDTTMNAEAVPTTPNMITQLLAHPRTIANFAPLTRDEIYERK